MTRTQRNSTPEVGPARSPNACVNPRCTCDPCTCTVCHCGATRLGDLERRVIGILWRDQALELTVRDIAVELPDHAYTTVATVLDRLVHKGLVRRRVVGRLVRFRPTTTSAEHSAGAMHDALVTSDDPIAALQGFAAMLSMSETDALRAALGALVE